MYAHVRYMCVCVVGSCDWNMVCVWLMCVELYVWLCVVVVFFLCVCVHIVSIR